MFTKEQETKIKTIRKRFVRVHGQGDWVKIWNYTTLGLKESEVIRLMGGNRKVVRYWINEIKTLCKNKN